MPVRVKPAKSVKSIKRNSGYVVTDGNKVLGAHATKKAARKQQAAVYANTGGRKRKSSKRRPSGR